MRIKIIKNHYKYRKGQVIRLSASKAMELVDKGVAILSKDMNQEDYHG